jgi:hypothetical protein
LVKWLLNSYSRCRDRFSSSRGRTSSSKCRTNRCRCLWEDHLLPDPQWQARLGVSPALPYLLEWVRDHRDRCLRGLLDKGLPAREVDWLRGNADAFDRLFDLLEASKEETHG